MDSSPRHYFWHPTHTHIFLPGVPKEAPGFLSLPLWLSVLQIPWSSSCSFSSDPNTFLYNISQWHDITMRIKHKLVTLAESTYNILISLQSLNEPLPLYSSFPAFKYTKLVLTSGPKPVVYNTCNDFSKTSSNPTHSLIIFFVNFHVSIYTWVHTWVGIYMPQWVCGGHRKTCGSQFSLLCGIWGLNSDIHAWQQAPFLHWAILPALSQLILIVQVSGASLIPTHIKIMCCSASLLALLMLYLIFLLT